MKLGFWTGNQNVEHFPKATPTATDVFLNFTYFKEGQYRTFQFFNQRYPQDAVDMLRRLIEEIAAERFD